MSMGHSAAWRAEGCQQGLPAWGSGHSPAVGLDNHRTRGSPQSLIPPLWAVSGPEGLRGTGRGQCVSLVGTCLF